MMQKNFRLPGRSVCLALTAAFLLAACEGGSAQKDSGAPAQTAEVQRYAEPVRKSEKDGAGVQMLLPDFTRLVEEVGPAVVHIQASGSTSETPLLFQGEASPFSEFFRRILPEVENENVSYGSGFIISADGYILTNTHVIKGSSSVKVSLTDKREFPAKVIGQDTDSDIALLKIEAENLPVAKIGDSNDLRVGEWVAAIGAPFGFDNTVTSGIVSAKKRSLPGENYVPFIQTDVAINPGNSGGPLFNLDGEVVGINSQIYSRSGGFMGISFAVPIDVAVNVMEQLKTTGVVKRGQLGVIIQEVNYDLSRAFGLERARGGLIVKIMENGAAKDADVRIGDIILAVNGQDVESSSDLPVIIGYTPPGSTVRLTLWREGKVLEVDVKLGEVGKSSVERAPQMRIPQSGSGTFSLPEYGLTLAPLSPAQAQQYNIGGGLIVLQAERGGRTVRLMRGDVIVSVGNTPVDSEKVFKDALSHYRGEAPLFILRNNQPLYLALPLGKK